jgi:FkbM family methyltransferase
MGLIKRAGRKLSGMLGYEMISRHAFQEQQQKLSNANYTLERLHVIVNHIKAPENDPSGYYGLVRLISENFMSSKSQLFQDVFVLHVLNNKRNGFFIEFGATNGVSMSNTYMLEKEYGWKGILAEPAIVWQADLKNNRAALIDNRCVWNRTGETLQFFETAEPELSTINTYSDSDFHSDTRKEKISYDVKTISLYDLLQEHNAPKNIDYLSIDTEGSEFEILEAFDFSAYDIKVITAEHNFTPYREKIFDLLTAKGYKRMFTEISLFDDWYVKQ